MPHGLVIGSVVAKAAAQKRANASMPHEVGRNNLVAPEPTRLATIPSPRWKDVQRREGSYGGGVRR